MFAVKSLGKFSLGIGDRFSHQGKAQLAALKEAKKHGISIVPVWNKSHREHMIIGSSPADVQIEAEEAVRALSWEDSFYVDADHIGLHNVDSFLEHSDFFTLDVADFIDSPADEIKIRKFVEKSSQYIGEILIPGMSDPITITKDLIEKSARQFLYAVDEAAKIYGHILEKKRNDQFVIEISMDETDEPQTPIELFFILLAVSQAGIPVTTIAPKFSGRFNKGVDYAGDIRQFTKEFEDDLAVIAYAVREFGLPANLKLSVHSGSDKFSIYKPIQAALTKFDAGLHLKTAGTTWLEELIGLAEAGGEGVNIVREIYRDACSRYDELCGPYATVIDIDPSQLPKPEEVNQWDGEMIASTLRHDQDNPHYNLHFRQLLHVAYKIAAEMGERYLNALRENEIVIARNVTENLFKRHIMRIFFK
jgi:hypothetical protein